MTAVTHPRLPPRRGPVRPASWWGRAWLRAVEEAAYAEADLARARRLARSGAVGQLTVDEGSFVAAVAERDQLWTVAGRCERLPPDDWALFAELVAAESGRVAALLAGELPHALVEDAEQSGVELLPWAGDLSADCGCAEWTDPCPHALAVGYQLGWLLDRDPFVLLHLRGLTREALLAALHAVPGPPADTAPLADLEVAAEAARRAAELLADLDDPADRPPPQG